MVERVEFDASVPAEPMHKRWKSEGTGAVTMQGKKRKRGDDKEIVAEGVVEDAESALPPLWSNGIRTSGSAGVVVFVDGKSARGAMRGVLRVVKEEGEVVWRGEEGGMGVERKLPYFYICCRKEVGANSHVQAISRIITSCTRRHLFFNLA